MENNEKITIMNIVFLPGHTLIEKSHLATATEVVLRALDLFSIWVHNKNSRQNEEKEINGEHTK